MPESCSTQGRSHCFWTRANKTNGICKKNRNQWIMWLEYDCNNKNGNYIHKFILGLNCDWRATFLNLKPSKTLISAFAPGFHDYFFGFVNVNISFGNPNDDSFWNLSICGRTIDDNSKSAGSVRISFPRRQRQFCLPSQNHSRLHSATTLHHA